MRARGLGALAAFAVLLAAGEARLRTRTELWHQTRHYRGSVVRIEMREGATTRVAKHAAADAWRRWYVAFTGFPFPLGPLFFRRTVMSEIHPGKVWALEQQQSLGFGEGSTIAANSRMVVVRLATGDLWLLNPLAPTAECIDLLRSLGGDVGHIVIGSTQYEHKVFAAPMSRRFPRAKVWSVPDQYSFPLDLPLPLLGINASPLRPGPRQPTWVSELPFALLRPRRRLGLGYSAVEAAFVHRASKSLLLTDALVLVPREAPEVLDRENLRALGAPGNLLSRLAAAANWRGAGEYIRAADERQSARPQEEHVLARRGWHRNAILALFFGPAPDAIADPGLAFSAIRGRWIVGPVCAALVYQAEPVREALRQWVDEIASGRLGEFTTIVPAHFAVGRGTPREVRRAFAPVFKQRLPYRKADAKLLNDLARLLRKARII